MAETGSLVDEIWDAVSDRVGEDLRVVTRYDGSEFATRMREDVRETYSSTEDQQIVDTTVVSQLAHQEIERAHKSGDLHGVVRIFDEAWVLSWPDSIPGKSGVIVSIQRDGATASFDDVEWCLGYLDEEIGPRIA